MCRWLPEYVQSPLHGLLIPLTVLLRISSEDTISSSLPTPTLWLIWTKVRDPLFSQSTFAQATVKICRITCSARSLS